MKDKEKQQVKAKHGKDVKEIPVALDGLAIYVNESNPIKEITIAQLKGIYTHKVKNWSELGGSDAMIVTYGRENNSGTYAYFKEHVLENADFAAEVQTLPGTAAVVNAVSKDVHGMGYGGIGYGKGIKLVPVRKDDKSPAVPPTMENVVNNTYPISRELYFYTVGEPTGEVKAFIDWVLGAEGQKVCEEVGYYPLRKK
jgi:phosphate transport system substrate-binding protein